MTDSLWTPSREAALARLHAFRPNAGRAYASTRNYDLGPADRSNVSALSPWIRYRALTEAEVVAATLEQHSPAASEKFIQEVLWRTYFKGWLQLRPRVWDRYRDQLARDFMQIEKDGALRQRYEAAVAGETGIDCYDAWARELVETGWLHNHARMWVSSIWIFTLELPWTLGADFFYRHLLDGDPASNTLSWRWTAGLQTRGKTYLARASNIEKYTEGRFNPEGALAPEAPALPFEEHPSITPLADADRLVDGDDPVSNAGGQGQLFSTAAEQPPLDGPVGLLVTLEDLRADQHLPPNAVEAVAVLNEGENRSPEAAQQGMAATGPLVCDHQAGLLKDAATRMESAFGASPAMIHAPELVDWARGAGLRTIVTPEAAVGPTADAMASRAADLDAAGIQLVYSRRRWDELLWPLATKGYFPFKKKFPSRLAEMGFPGF